MIITGLLGLGGITYVTDQIVEGIDSAIVNPVKNWINKERNDAMNREFELTRQQMIIRIKEQNRKRDELRDLYDIRPREYFKVINCSAIDAYIIYVNHYQALDDDDEAIEWAKICMINSPFDGEYWNKKSTKVIKLAPNDILELIPMELNEYTIVIYHHDTYKVIKKEDLEKEIKLM